MLVEVSNIRQKYLENYKCASTFIQNFVMSSVNTIVAFTSAETQFHSWISVLDLNFSPLFTYETNASIHCCDISDDGRYIVWQTASSSEDDSNSLFLFDVSTKSLLWKKSAPIHCKYLSGIYIGLDDDEIECVYEDISIKYNFNGEELYPEQNYKNMIKSNCVSPYYWNYEASKIIDSLNDEFNEDVEHEVLERLYASERNTKMSGYQLSLTYKKLGDCYLANGYNDKALSAYKKGLELNEKLPVKRLISKLTKTVR